MTDPTDNVDAIDYESQDLSALEEHRSTDLIWFGIRFRVSEPESYQEGRALFDPVKDVETWAHRTLSILVDEPSPLRPVLDHLTPWHAVLLAAECLTWLRADEYLDEIENLRELQSNDPTSLGSLR
ncbi:hypothetical protein ACFPYI_20945 [Halomarina salina]|uniref:Uncharacterized protein n=1 Tax=Halomarina salina TaxID=1872699 RepID=A0ABD5RUI9_9EURY|nr:hypothetical protein [Halomarina salina]